MASGLTFKRAAGYLAALAPLWGFVVTRLWALLGGHLSEELTIFISFLVNDAILILWWNLKLGQKLIDAIQERPANLLAAIPGFLVGGSLNISYTMMSTPGVWLEMPIFHTLSNLGSGLVLTVLLLAVLSASQDWGEVDTGSRWQFFTLFLLVNALAAFYIIGSSTVYIWDNAGYWSVARNLAAQPLTADQFRQVAASTVTLDYNYLLAFPISILMRMCGGSRAVFLLTAVNLYLIPALWGLCVLGSRWKWGGLYLTLLLPGLVYLTLVGYVDVAAGGAAIWAFAVYTKKGAPPWARGVLAGVLLTLSFLLRRYFLFFALSFGVAALVRAIMEGKKEWPAFGALFGAAAATSIYGAQAFLVDKLTTNYRDIYSAYELGMQSDVMLFCRYFGFVVLALAVGRGVRLLVLRQRRSDALMALVQLGVCLFLVTRVQSHGQQHTLLYLPALAVLLAPGDAETAPKWQPKAAWALAVCATLVTLLPRPQPASISEIKVPDALPGFSFHGPKRSDIDELTALADRLDSLADGETTAAVCASSFLFTGETMTNLRPSLNLPEPKTGMKYIYMTSVDKRDGFSWNVLGADYLVVGDPVQVHLGEENQQVVALLAHAVLDHTGVGTAYERLPGSYTLQDGAHIYIYRRTREVTAAERESIARALREKYPDYTWLYQAP